MGVDRARGFPRDHRTHHVADGDRLGTFCLGLTLGGDGVGGFAGLRDEQGNCIWVEDRVAIAPLAGIIYFNRHPRQAFDHELAGLPGMPTRAASRNIDLFHCPKFCLRDFHFIKEDVARVL